MDNEQIDQLAKGDRDDSLRVLYFAPPFGDINNAVAEHLERARTKHDRINITAQYSPQAEPTRVCYLMSMDYLLGFRGLYSVGEVRVRARRSGDIELHLVSPPQNERRELTEGESVALMSAAPEAWDQLYEDLKKKRDDERDLQHAGALFFHQQVMTTFLQSLLNELEPLHDTEKVESVSGTYHDVLVPKGESPPRPPTQAEFNSMTEFYDAMCDYYEIVEKPKGIKIGAFAATHGIDPGTFYKRRSELNRSTPRRKKTG